MAFQKRQNAESSPGGFEDEVVRIYRCTTVVKGGQRFSFAALVVVGDRRGQVGIGYGKANQVPSAIEKGQKEAKRRMQRYTLQGRTIPHTVTGRFGACLVRLVPLTVAAREGGLKF